MIKFSGLSGWVFIAVGFVVIAISIFFYDTLKIFIAIGGFMVVYGLGKLSYDQFKAKLFPPEKEEEPIDLNKIPNPYLQAQQVQKQAPKQLSSTHQAYQVPQIPTQHRRVASTPNLHPKYNVSRSYSSPLQRSHHYCHLCGNPLHRDDRFCSSCGTRIGR